MNGLRFDAFARQLGRRRALQALGTAAVATVSGVALADAKKGKNNNGNNKQKKKGEKKALALCAGQVAECDALSAQICEGDAECLTRNLLCCDLLATCAFTEFIACINEPVNNPDL